MLSKQILLALATLLSACSTTSNIVGDFTGTVTKVHDGDSIHITPSGKKRVVIRLAGIDAPEIKQAHGIASRDTLRSLALQRTAEAECHKTDRYRRYVCVVYINGEDINLQMIKAGMAWHYKAYQDEQSRQQRQQYSRAQANAQERGIGLWDGQSVEPWVFRQMN